VSTWTRCGDFRTSYREDAALFDTPFQRWALAALLLALATLPLWATSYWLDVANRIGIAVIAAMGLNILTGFTGQISLGNAAFLAVGAYTTAYLGRLGVPFPIVLPVAGLVTALAGMFFGVPSLRLKGLYLAMATLAAHFVVEFVVVHWESVTGGVQGATVMPPRAGALELDSDARIFWLVLPCAAGLLLFARNLFRTRVGKAFVAVRDHDISAEVMGVRVVRYKLLAFAVSSFYVGVAGALLAYQARIISPENFPITLAIDQLGMIIIGGLGSVLGSVLGAAFLTLLPELLRIATGALADFWPPLTGLFASLKSGLFGLVIVLFLVFEPDGMAARWRTIRAWWKLYPFSY
jgi:branched-chain amino acid transport system permease protein